MLLSSALCRAQEMAQRKRADDAILDNVRNLALRAAAAWSIEAEAAEIRETRHAAGAPRPAMTADEGGVPDDDEADFDTDDRQLTA